MDSPRPAVPYSVVVETEYGRMIVSRHDLNQTEALFRSGKALDYREIEVLGRILEGIYLDPVVLDVGANVGAYALGLARRVGNGVIHTFEAQRIIFNMLAGSVALNGLLNVRCHNLAIGATDGWLEIPQFDYYRPMNFGSVEFGPEQREMLTQERGHDPARAEFVSSRSIDSLDFPHVDLIKMDIEGMESDALRGAERTIARDKPVMFVETLKSDESALRTQIEVMGYTTHKMFTDNVLCVPIHLAERIEVG